MDIHIHMNMVEQETGINISALTGGAAGQSGESGGLSGLLGIASGQSSGTTGSNDLSGILGLVDGLTGSTGGVTNGDIGELEDLSKLLEGLGGITNSGAGYAQSTFRPGIESELEYANTSIDALVGRLVSNWRMENGDLIWNIEVPANTTATVKISLATAKSITESGKDIFMKDGEGITYVGREENGDYIYTVGGGSYCFVASETPIANENPDTNPDTDVVTEPVKDEVTTAPETDAPEEKGCGSSLGFGIAAVTAAAAAAVALRKKDE